MRWLSGLWLNAFGWTMPHLTWRIENDGNEFALWKLTDESNRLKQIYAKLPLKDKKDYTVNRTWQKPDYINTSINKTKSMLLLRRWNRDLGSGQLHA